MSEPNPMIPATNNADSSRQKSSPGGINAVAAERGMQWLVIGWRLFLKAPWVWLGISVALMVAFALIGMVPLFGQLAIAFLMPVAAAGLLAGCQALERGEELRFDHLFAGFRRNTSQLVVIGVLSLVGHAAITLVVFAVGGGGMMSGMMIGAWPGAALALGSLLFALLLGMALLVPLAMALWFAPALVLFADREAVAALKSSFAGCLKNMLPFLIYGIVGLILLVLALLPLLLGLLVLIPVLAGSVYAAYDDIYGQGVAPPSSPVTAP